MKEKNKDINFTYEMNHFLQSNELSEGIKSSIIKEKNINFPKYQNFIFKNNKSDLNSKLMSENSNNNIKQIKAPFKSNGNKNISFNNADFKNFNFLSKNDKLIPYFYGLKISNKFNKNQNNFYNDLENKLEYNKNNQNNSYDLLNQKNRIDNNEEIIKNDAINNDNFLKFDYSYINNTIDEKRNIYKENTESNIIINNNQNSINSLNSNKITDYLNKTNTINNFYLKKNFNKDKRKTEEIKLDSYIVNDNKEYIQINALKKTIILLKVDI